MFRYYTKKVGDEEYLYCAFCHRGLWLADGRALYCPTCWRGEHNERGEKPKGILCCAECDNPLQATNPLGGGYCTHCNFHPSMQDLTLRLLCSEKGCYGLLESDGCPICNTLKKANPASL